MNNILQDQNRDNAIILLKAQRVAYNSAKNYFYVDLISVLLAVTFTLCLIFNVQHNYIKNLSVLGVAWTIISIFSEFFRAKATKVGATIQEQFDVELFKLSWNNISVPEKIDIGKIVQLSRNYSQQDLKDWYSKEISGNIPHNLAVLLCYKNNVLWALLLRNKFSNFIIGSLIVYYGSLLCLAVKNNIGWFDFALLISPSLPFLVYGVTTIKNQIDIIKKNREIDKVLMRLIDDYKEHKNIPSIDSLRQIQNLFFTQRLIPHKVPDWFYKFFRKSSEDIVDEALKRIVNDLN